MKKIVISLLAYLGYSLVKIRRKKLVKKDTSVNIGKYRMDIPANNPLSYTYATDADFSSEISLIVSIIYKKYPKLFAIDVGANIGDSFLRIKNIDNQIPVACVEGDTFSFIYLKKNTEAFENVFLFNNFLGEQSAVKNISFEKKGWNTTLLPDTNSKDSVEFITLDYLLQLHFPQKEGMKFLKIDTEGFDTIILRGASLLLHESKPIIYMEYNRDNMAALKEDGLSTVLSLSKQGYNRILVYDDTGKYILSSALSDIHLMKSIDSYIGGKSRLVTYYNFCIFPFEDEDVANEIMMCEIEHNIS